MTIKASDLSVGLLLSFTQYAEGEPADGFKLKEGDKLSVVSFEETQDGVLDITAEIANPAFNSKKKPSKSNPKMLQVNVWEDEVELVKEETKAKSKTKSRTKPKAAEKEEAAEEAPKAKAKSKAKPAKEKAAKPKVKKEKVAKEPAAPAPYVPEWEALKKEDAEVVALVEEAEGELSELAIETVEQRGGLDHRLGGILYHLARNGEFQNYGGEGKYEGAKGFTKFCEEVLEIQYRKACYLINIYVQFAKLGIDGAEVAKIGWTKARAIAETAAMAEKDEGIKFDKKDAKALIKLAKQDDTTVKSLDEHIKATYRSGDAVREKFIKITMSLPEARASQILDIIEGAKEQFAVEDTSDVLAKIVEEWHTECAEA